ncbi:uncharacterized transmembrane protein DDB_G0289901-like [Achroia grisella]|uniref:uncharacterized transmembrane protein DDB_G0289901-like n=1 Tax=Achroia grisella TaxID=688607 RepID=UPI0027D28209|nr:uncharacterized transmembrane protein DDB_G0289901-like [Achroia grisella]
MYFSIRLLLCTVFVFCLLDPNTEAKRSFGGGSRSSYPSSRGLSGSHSSHRYPSGGGHSYPSSGGLSGGGHSYPSSGGLSGGGHSYPSSGGLSGGSHSYPSSGTKPQSHGYPSSGGIAGQRGGSHSYPGSGGLSGSGSRPQSHYPSSGNTHTSYNSHTTVHHHYNYAPPQQIRYTSSSGVMTYPVYHSPPPTYVYQYRDSGSRYGTLLAGLALFNLGALAGVAGSAAYAHSHGSGGSQYKPQPGEVCKFGLKKNNGDYEETRIDCQIITSFILSSSGDNQNSPTNNANNTTVTTTTVTNVTTVNSNNPAVVPLTPMGGDVMLPNGTLVPVNNTSTSSVTVTTTTTNTTTITNALDVKGDPIQVTSGMKCYVIRITPVNNMKKTIDCGVLQAYAEQSLKRNSALRNIPSVTVLATFIIAFIVY